MKKFIRENWFKSIISLTLIIVSISAVYYFIILPNKISEMNKTKEIEALSQKIDDLSQEKPIQDTASEVSNIQQDNKSNIVDTNTPKEDPQLKIEKCKAIADKQAQAGATAIADVQRHYNDEITKKIC